MLYLWAWKSYAVIAQLFQEPVGSSFAVAEAVVVAVAEAVAEAEAVPADAECVVRVGTGAKGSVVGQTDVMELAEAGRERAAVEKPVWLVMGAEVVPGQTAVRWAVQVAVAVVAAAVADEPASAATAWTAGADGFAGTAADITVLGSWVLMSLYLHHLPAASGEAERTSNPGA